MKKRLPIDSSIIEFFILIILAMTSLLYLNGCTDKALQIAEDKASPENTECLLDNTPCYWYPIEKTKRGCESIDLTIASSIFVLPIENISMNKKSRHQLYNLMIDFNKTQPVKERIFEVSFVFDGEDTEKDADKDEVPA